MFSILMFEQKRNAEVEGQPSWFWDLEIWPMRKVQLFAAESRHQELYETTAQTFRTGEAYKKSSEALECPTYDG